VISRWRPALTLWLGSRVAVTVAAVTAAWAVQDVQGRDVPGFLRLWDRWDVQLFWKVARYGYLSPAYQDRTEVDFPGMPWALRVVHVVVRDWVAAGLVVSALAMAVACVVLWRLAADESGEQGGRHAVLFLVLAPYAVFLYAGYSEALFLAFSIAAWLFATRGRWPLATVLAAGATATRVTGVPFAVALAVLYLTQRRGQLDRNAPWLVVPALPVIGYVVYLHSRTGHWDAYLRAQREGWQRRVASPITGWTTTWDQAFNGHQAASFEWFWRAELVAVVLGVVVTVVLLWQRRWAEATYVGLTTAQMSATSFFASGVRVALVWFPLYLLLARLASRRAWVLPAYAWVCAPLMVTFVVAFTQGSWVD
jgi:hypothetical protein